MAVTTLPEKTQMAVYEGQTRGVISRPKKFFLAQLHRSGYFLRMPLELSFEHEDEGFTVSDEIFHLYGEGSSLEDALHDYEDSLVGFFEGLENNADHLAQHLKQQLENLRKYISRA